ncbi:MAG: hypothetical protein IJ762_09405 [Bacteroidaceae bacterium]|nr:hypothetical protein [Bacteroidaceae bacterium]MBR1789386.1 hypothetical protein [Bacteroidaceae bacterium]
MSNLRLTGFLILGLSLALGIVLWRMHEPQWAHLLFALAGLQAIVLALNWNKERKRRKFRKV